MPFGTVSDTFLTFLKLKKLFLKRYTNLQPKIYQLRLKSSGEAVSGAKVGGLIKKAEVILIIFFTVGLAIKSLNPDKTVLSNLWCRKYMYLSDCEVTFTENKPTASERSKN